MRHIPNNHYLQNLTLFAIKIKCIDIDPLSLFSLVVHLYFGCSLIDRNLQDNVCLANIRNHVMFSNGVNCAKSEMIVKK